MNFPHVRVGAGIFDLFRQRVLVGRVPIQMAGELFARWIDGMCPNIEESPHSDPVNAGFPLEFTQRPDEIIYDVMVDRVLEVWSMAKVRNGSLRIVLRKSNKLWEISFLMPKLIYGTKGASYVRRREKFSAKSCSGLFSMKYFLFRKNEAGHDGENNLLSRAGRAQRRRIPLLM